MTLGQAVLAASLFAATWTTSAAALTIDLAVMGTASGVACGAAQALLVAGDPAGADRVMVRWTLFASLGDVLAPLVTAAAIALGWSYRGAMAAVGVLVAVQCVLGLGSLAGRKGAPEHEPLPEPAPRAAALSRALRMPRLWAWLFAASTCTLLDEIVVALAALRMGSSHGDAEAVCAAAAGAFSMGAVLGSAVTDRVVARLGSRAVLLASGAATLVLVGALVASHGVVLAAMALFLLGAACAPHHGLALAKAYDLLPANPGTVQALGQVFVVVDVGAPLALGLAADRLGIRAALAMLAIQPIVILVCALLLEGRGDGEAPRRQGAK